jgi:hypothetical protein
MASKPIIITAPDSGGRYMMIEIVDMWDNAFAYAAGKEGELPPAVSSDILIPAIL